MAHPTPRPPGRQLKKLQNSSANAPHKTSSPQRPSKTQTFAGCPHKKASLSLRPQAQKNSNPFFPAACTSGKTLLALQVWNFCAEGAEIMRAAGCNPLKREPSEAVSESQNLRFCPSSLCSAVSFESGCQKFFLTPAHTSCCSLIINLKCSPSSSAALRHRSIRCIKISK